jgi:hypothetical protein
MKTAAAYLLAKLGGVAEPSAADIARILGSGTLLRDALDSQDRKRTYRGCGSHTCEFGRRDSRSRSREFRAARRPFPVPPPRGQDAAGVASF